MDSDFLAQSLSDWPVKHLAAAVINGEEQVTYGDQNRVFELASVTKLLTAYGVLLAVEEGAFGDEELDAPLGPVGSTVRHLLAHASGCGFNSRTPERGVGEKRIYSSAGYEWLAEGVVQRTGMEFAEYLDEGVFQPLGMTHTQLRGSAGHGAVSTVADLAGFARELLHPSLLHSSSLAGAFGVAFPELNGIVPGYGMHKPCPWGLGPEIKGEKSPHWTGENMPKETLGHFGLSGTYFWVVPGDDTTTDKAMVLLGDKEFGEWAKPLWADTNEKIWAELT